MNARHSPETSAHGKGLATIDELLAALRGIERLLSALNNDEKPLAVKESNVNAAWHLAHDAIAKAGRL